MAVSHEDGTAERLSQVRAQRRHVGRLRVAEQRDAAHKRAAAFCRRGGPHSNSNRAALVADREVEVEDGIEMEV